MARDNNISKTPSQAPQTRQSLWQRFTNPTEPPDTANGGGFGGAVRRGWAGFRQGITPDTTSQRALMAVSPGAGLLRGGIEAIKDVVQGSDWYQRRQGGGGQSNSGSAVQRTGPYRNAYQYPTTNTGPQRNGYNPSQPNDFAYDPNSPLPPGESAGPPAPQMNRMPPVASEAPRMSGGASLFNQLRRNPNMANGGPIGSQAEAVSAQGVAALDEAQRRYRERAMGITQ